MTAVRGEGGPVPRSGERPNKGRAGCAQGRNRKRGPVMAEAVEVSHFAPIEPPVVPKGDQADGVPLAGQILTGVRAARWPMYLRNVKQLLRATQGGFDERRYGFMRLIDLLRACQREGLVRLERDRRGGLRVLKGPALQQTGPSPAIAPSQEVMEAGRLGMLDTQPVDAVDRFELEERAEEDRYNGEPMPTDTTAEPPGRAKQRRPRARVAAAAPVAARVPRKAIPKKPPARATKRSRKPAGSEAPGKKEH